MPYNFGLLKRIREACIPEEATNNFVLQDFGLPLRHLKKGIEFYHEQVEVYPVWLCPAKAFDTGPVHAVKDESKDPIHVDIGLYGYSPKPNFDAHEALRKMEKFTREHAGYQVIDNFKCLSNIPLVSPVYDLCLFSVYIKSL